MSDDKDIQKLFAQMTFRQRFKVISGGLTVVLVSAIFSISLVNVVVIGTELVIHTIEVIKNEK